MTEEPLYPTFSREEFDRRHRNARSLMEGSDLAALLLYGRGSSPEIQYLSNWRVTREAHLVFPRAGDPTLFVQLSNHLPNARRLSIFPPQVLDDPDDQGPDQECLVLVVGHVLDRQDSVAAQQLGDVRWVAALEETARRPGPQ